MSNLIMKESESSVEPCGGPDRICLVAEARGEYSRCQGECAYAERRKPHEQPRFANVSCSQCGQDFGPGNHGFSHCKDHTTKREERG
jgi:hypothetical protein